jgi:hypothetical protein
VIFRPCLILSYSAALGVIVITDFGYALRIVVAELIRELLVGRFDLHIFWPAGTSPSTFAEFPLSEQSDSQWMERILEFLGQVDLGREFHRDR